MSKRDDILASVNDQMTDITQALHTDSTPGALLLTIPQAAGLLGMSPRRLYTLVAQGALPEAMIIRLGRAVRLSGPRLWRWLGADGAGTDKTTEASAGSLIRVGTYNAVCQTGPDPESKQGANAGATR